MAYSSVSEPISSMAPLFIIIVAASGIVNTLKPDFSIYVRISNIAVVLPAQGPPVRHILYITGLPFSIVSIYSSWNEAPSPPSFLSFVLCFFCFIAGFTNSSESVSLILASYSSVRLMTSFSNSNIS